MSDPTDTDEDVQIAEQLGDDLDDVEPDDAGASVGQTIGTALAWPFVATGRGCYWVGATWAGAIAKHVPNNEAIGQKLAIAGYNLLYKGTDAHFVVNTIYGDGTVIPWPGMYDKGEQKVKTINGEEWAAPNGVEPHFIGESRVIWGVADDHEPVNPIAARLGEAVDLDARRKGAVEHTDEGVKPVQFVPPDQEVPETPAAADGGLSQYDVAAVERTVQAIANEDAEYEDALVSAAQRLRTYFRERIGVHRLEPSHTFDDVIVDARNPDPEADGWIVSLAKAYDLHWGQASSEEMQNQETRGRLMERDPEEGMNEFTRGLIYGVGIVLGTIALLMLGVYILGGSGGGMPIPNVNPFALVPGI